MAFHYSFTMNPQAFMSKESREGQQSSAAPNITTSGGSPSSSVNMAKFQMPPLDILELNNGFLASNWRTWVAAWKNYTLATKLDKEEQAHQVATLLAVIGKEANKVFCMFTFSSPDEGKKIMPILRKFKEYCIPRENSIHGRFLFFTSSLVKILRIWTLRLCFRRILYFEQIFFFTKILCSINQGYFSFDILFVVLLLN